MSADDSSIEETIALVARAQHDDVEARELLFARYLPRVRRIAAVRLGRTSLQLFEVDDLVQESMVDALRGLQSFRLDSDGRFCNWLARIVENRIRKQLRFVAARKRGGGQVQRFADADDSVHDSALQGAEPTPSMKLRGVEAEQRVEEALLDMPDRSRDLLVQRLFAEMSYDEIAAEMDLASPDSARALFSKALRELGQRMKSEG